MDKQHFDNDAVQRYLYDNSYDIYEDLEEDVYSRTQQIGGDVEDCAERKSTLNTETDKVQDPALDEKNEQLKEENALLRQHISELYKTAKCELDRKHREIVELRQKLDDLLLRRIRPHADANRVYAKENSKFGIERPESATRQENYSAEEDGTANNIQTKIHQDLPNVFNEKILKDDDLSNRYYTEFDKRNHSMYSETRNNGHTHDRPKSWRQNKNAPYKYDKKMCDIEHSRLSKDFSHVVNNEQAAVKSDVKDEQNRGKLATKHGTEKHIFEDKNRKIEQETEENSIGTSASIKHKDETLKQSSSADTICRRKSPLRSGNCKDMNRGSRDRSRNRFKSESSSRGYLRKDYDEVIRTTYKRSRSKSRGRNCGDEKDICYDPLTRKHFNDTKRHDSFSNEDRDYKKDVKPVGTETNERRRRKTPPTDKTSLEDTKVQEVNINELQIGKTPPKAPKAACFQDTNLKEMEIKFGEPNRMKTPPKTVKPSLEDRRVPEHQSRGILETINKQPEFKKHTDPTDIADCVILHESDSEIDLSVPDEVDNRPSSTDYESKAVEELLEIKKKLLLQVVEGEINCPVSKHKSKKDVSNKNKKKRKNKNSPKSNEKNVKKPKFDSMQDQFSEYKINILSDIVVCDPNDKQQFSGTVKWNLCEDNLNDAEDDCFLKQTVQPGNEKSTNSQENDNFEAPQLLASRVENAEDMTKINHSGDILVFKTNDDAEKHHQFNRIVEESNIKSSDTETKQAVNDSSDTGLEAWYEEKCIRLLQSSHLPNKGLNTEISKKLDSKSESSKAESEVHIASDKSAEPAAFFDMSNYKIPKISESAKKHQVPESQQKTVITVKSVTHTLNDKRTLEQPLEEQHQQKEDDNKPVDVVEDNVGQSGDILVFEFNEFKQYSAEEEQPRPENVEGDNIRMLSKEENEAVQDNSDRRLETWYEENCINLQQHSNTPNKSVNKEISNALTNENQNMGSTNEAQRDIDNVDSLKEQEDSNSEKMSLNNGSKQKTDVNRLEFAEQTLHDLRLRDGEMRDLRQPVKENNERLEEDRKRISNDNQYEDVLAQLELSSDTEHENSALQEDDKVIECRWDEEDGQVSISNNNNEEKDRLDMIKKILSDATKEAFKSHLVPIEHKINIIRMEVGKTLQRNERKNKQSCNKPRKKLKTMFPTIRLSKPNRKNTRKTIETTEKSNHYGSNGQKIKNAKANKKKGSVPTNDVTFSDISKNKSLEETAAEKSNDDNNHEQKSNKAKANNKIADYSKDPIEDVALNDAPSEVSEVCVTLESKKSPSVSMKFGMSRGKCMSKLKELYEFENKQDDNEINSSSTCSHPLDAMLTPKTESRRRKSISKSQDISEKVENASCTKLNFKSMTPNTKAETNQDSSSGTCESQTPKSINGKWSDKECIKRKNLLSTPKTKRTKKANPTPTKKVQVKSGTSSQGSFPENQESQAKDDPLARFENLLEQKPKANNMDERPSIHGTIPVLHIEEASHNKSVCNWVDCIDANNSANISIQGTKGTGQETMVTFSNYLNLKKATSTPLSNKRSCHLQNYLNSDSSFATSELELVNGLTKKQTFSENAKDIDKAVITRNELSDFSSRSDGNLSKINYTFGVPLKRARKRPQVMTISI